MDELAKRRTSHISSAAWAMVSGTRKGNDQLMTALKVARISKSLDQHQSPRPIIEPPPATSPSRAMPSYYARFQAPVQKPLFRIAHPRGRKSAVEGQRVSVRETVDGHS